MKVAPAGFAWAATSSPKMFRTGARWSSSRHESGLVEEKRTRRGHWRSGIHGPKSPRRFTPSGRCGRTTSGV